MYRKPYIESSAFIAFIKGELRDDDKHDCKKVMDSILEAASRGKFQIYTSTLTIAEVFKKKNADPLTRQENEDLRPYFREPYIQVVEVDRAIGERANELCRTPSSDPAIRPLRPNDAVHIACAERAGCEVLLGYDSVMNEQTHPTIQIKWPEEIIQNAENLELLLEAGKPLSQTILALPAPTPVAPELSIGRLIELPEDSEPA